MKSPERLWQIPLMMVVCAVTIWLALAFMGILDSGKFEIIQSQSVAISNIAMLCRRSDNVALSGDTYFVVIADHRYSAIELKRALHSSLPVFIAGRDGLNISADKPNVLTIECRDCRITKNIIEKQRFKYGNIEIRYIGFP